MGFLDDCEKYFGTNDLYKLFGVPATINENELKKAYHKISLKVHPDKATEESKEDATRQFQIVAKAYFILSDKEKRAIYDEQGLVEDDDLPQEKDWINYWRLLFPRITLKEIDNFKLKYKDSEDEREDLKSYYIRFEGDMLLIGQCMPCFEFEEEPRYREMLEEMITTGDIEAYPAFTSKENQAKIARKVKKAKKEAKEAEELQKELGLEAAEDNLFNAIAQRQKDRKNAFDDMISGLEAKYAKPKASKRGKKK